MDVTDATNEFSNPRWKAKWDMGCAPNTMWDKGTPSPLLTTYINEGKIPNGRALVPGCGRGYDVTALATANRYALGVDIVELAIQIANDRLAELSAEECRCKSNAEFRVASFFDLPHEKPEDLFDFIYDYTFMCALDPSVRVAWATKMAQLTKQDGIVITVIYPICDKEGGPPFKVSLELMSELMIPAGFECMELKMLPSELCHEGRDGSLVKDGTNEFRSSTGLGVWKKLYYSVQYYCAAFSDRRNRPHV